MSKTLTSNTRVRRFVEENFSDFSNRRKSRFVEQLEGKYAGCKHQAMWVIICHPRSENEEIEFVDSYAETHDEAKTKLRDFRKNAGKWRKCVVQKLLRVESGDDIWYLS